MIHAPQLRRLLMGLALAVWSCAPLNFTGKLCSATRACPAGWDCAKGVCRMAGTQNRVKNGDFESGPTGWVASHAARAALDGGHDSAGALAWRPDGTGDSVLTLDAPAVDAPQDGPWCAQAWVKGADDKEVTFEVVDQSDAVDWSTVRPSGGIWTKAQLDPRVNGEKTLSIRLTSPADAGARQLVVDDVALWPDLERSGCTAPP